MIVKIEISQNKELKRKLELYYSMYLDYNTSYLVSVLNTDKDWYKRKANEYLNKIIAIQSLLQRGEIEWVITIMIFISGI